MTVRPLVLLHGYSDRGESFERWRDILVTADRPSAEIRIGSYVSKTNEVTLPDLGEAFGRALELDAGLDDGQEFDVVVHSTGMLVLREWMSREESRRGRVKHIIGLAPATWGSPLAHKGKSLLGAIFKGEHHLGPDFMEAGNEILNALELGSSYTWELAGHDLIADEPRFGVDDTTPWPFIFVGTDAYGGLRRLVNEPGTDGTVRWSGVAFNSRRFTLDLTGEQGHAKLDSWHNVDAPLTFVPDKNHSSILRDPPQAIGEMVKEALEVDGLAAYQAWTAKYGWTLEKDGASATKGQLWQQFVIRAVDERGNSVPDWFLELCSVDSDGNYHRIEEFDLDVHTFANDPSYRCFHVDVQKLVKLKSGLGVLLSARSGTDYVAYLGSGSENFGLSAPDAAQAANVAGVQDPAPYKWDAKAEFSSVVTTDGRSAQILYPFTTTLIELKFNREPLPYPGVNRVLWFLNNRPS